MAIPHFTQMVLWAVLLPLAAADVVLCPLVSFADERYFVHTAARLGQQPHHVFTNQFENLANFNAHFTGTGPELWAQTNHHIDGFVCSAGTGGTLAGVFGRVMSGSGSSSSSVCGWRVGNRLMGWNGVEYSGV